MKVDRKRLIAFFLTLFMEIFGSDGKFITNYINLSLHITNNLLNFLSVKINQITEQRVISGEHCTVRITSSSVVDSDSPFSGVSGILNSTQYVNGDEPFKCQFIFLGSGTERVQIIFLYFHLYSRIPHLNNNTNR